MKLHELALDPELLWLITFGPGYGEALVILVPGDSGPTWITIDSLRRQDRRTDINPVLSLLRSKSAQLSCVVLTHPHRDHVLGLVQLLERRLAGTPVGCLPAYVDALPATKARDDAGWLLTRGAAAAALNRIDHIWRTERDARWELLAGEARRVGAARLEVLYPQSVPKKRPKDLNTISNPILLEWHDCRFLLGADLPRGGWRKIEKFYPDPQRLTSAQALKVAHHGSGPAQHELAIGMPPPKERFCVLTPYNSGKPVPDYGDGGGVEALLRSHLEVGVTSVSAAAQGKSTPRTQLAPVQGSFGELSLAYESSKASPRDSWIAVGFDTTGNEAKRLTGKAAGTVV